MERYDAIIFNNPHAGVDRTGARTADLIRRFVFSARNRLTSSGEVHVNITTSLVMKYGAVRAIVNTSTYSYGTFGSSPYFAPYLPRYTVGNRPFETYDNPMDVARLLNYVWR